MAAQSSIPEWVTVREAAAAYHYSESTIYHRIADGTIPAYRMRPRGRLLIRPEDLARAMRPRNDDGPGGTGPHVTSPAKAGGGDVDLAPNEPERPHALIFRWRLAIRDDPDLTTVQRAVAHTLATYMDLAGRCYPGMRTVALGAGCSERAARSAIRVLEERSYLLTFAGGGRHRVNHYQARLPESRHELPSNRGESRMAAETRQHGHETRHDVPPNPVARAAELEREIEGELGGPGPFPWERTLLSELVENLRDADEHTLGTFEKYFGDLEDELVDEAWDEIERRRESQTHPPLDNETAYAFAVLAIKTGLP